MLMAAISFHWQSSTCRRLLCVAAVCLLPLWASLPIAAAEPESKTDSCFRLNTIGYLPSSPKRATIATEKTEFLVRDVRTGDIVLRGALRPVAESLSKGATLMVADFSALDRTGTYRVEISDGSHSPDFRIADDVYNWPFYCATRAMYLWRCGTEVSADFAGRHFSHAACHLNDAYLDFVGGPNGQRRDGTGGWHDAGDYNKYTVNGAFTVGLMLKAWEHFADRLAPLKLDIPESNNQVPDLLDETRWELNWLLKMQSSDGRVYHKVSTRNFGGFVLPEKETQPRFFTPWSSAATADFAAVMAEASRAFQPFDKPFASRCLVASRKSYEFLRAHPADHHPEQSAFSTGGYDAPDADDRVWAAAELWETTGELQFLHDFELRMRSFQGRTKTATVDVNWDWANLRNLGTFTYLMSTRSGRDTELLARIRSDTLKAADAIVEAAHRSKYGRPMGDVYYWGCNGTVARQAINLHVAYRLTGDERYRHTALSALNYLFGRNPFGRSFITGLGFRPPLFPHDRRSGGDQVDLPWPGYLVGGPWPNAHDWHDVQDDYRTNEIAINWNGALIYALAMFVDPRGFEASIAAARSSAKAPSHENGAAQMEPTKNASHNDPYRAEAIQPANEH